MYTYINNIKSDFACWFWTFFGGVVKWVGVSY